MDDAKGLIRQKALKSSLIASAEEQGSELLELIRYLVENAGYTVEFVTVQQKTVSPDTSLIKD